MIEISFENEEAMLAQHEASASMIVRFVELRNKSGLTYDEFWRYIDLQSELSSASDPGVIQAIKDEMAGLEDKSRLSNDELNEKVGLNGDLTPALPGATEENSDQGNKVADISEELKNTMY